MPNTAEQLMSLDEFLAWEREQPERYEYARGVITMMTGASLAHATITMLLAHYSAERTISFLHPLS